MSRRLDLTIRQRLAFGFGAAGVLLGVLAVMSHVWTREIAAERRHLAVIVPRAEAADRLETAILYAAIAARNQILAPGAEHRLQFEAAVNRTRDEVQSLSGMPMDPDGLALFARIPPLADAYERAARATVAAADSRASLPGFEDEMSRAREELVAVVRQYAALQERKVDETRAAIGVAVERMGRAAIILGAFVFGLLAITGLLTAASVHEPALRLVTAARRVAAGDFDSAIALSTPGGPVARRDELAELSQSFGRMALDLKTREARLRASAKLASAMAASLDVARLCESALELLASHLGLEAGAVYLLTEGPKLRRLAARGLAAAEDEHVVGEGILGQATRSRRTVTGADAAELPFTLPGTPEPLPPRGVAAFPLVLQDQEVVGVMVVVAGRPLAPDAIEFLEHASNELAVSVQNAVAHERILQLATELQDKNEELQAQNEEIHAQQEELQAQHEELQAQGEELHVQADQLRRVLDDLAASEERYRGLFTHLSEGFALHEMIYDDTGRAVDCRFVAANAAFGEAIGLEADEITGRTVKEAIPGIEPSWIERCAEVVRTGEPMRFEEGSVAPGRHYRVVAFRVGERHFATLFMDATDEKRAEEALRQADRNKSEFLALLSHELRNPLAPIRNSLYVLGRAQPGSEQAIRAQQIIDRQVGQLARLVEDLLDVTRISRGKVQLRRTVVDLATLCRQAAEDNRADFSDNDLELTVQVPDGPVAVQGDPTRLSQVVGNLLQNAAKFTPRGGRVLLGLDVGGGTARLRVRDSGDGIDSETLGRLFQPFVQAEVNLARTNGGLGLGLALVKGLVELHGGSVRATSEGRGKGSEFVVELPTTNDAPPESRPEAAPPRPVRRVLVIEDNVDAADSLREALELGRHQVEVAYTGAQGLEKARAWRPAVVLCDVGLPDISGYEVAKAFRQDPALQSVFLVALTGYALPDDLKRASEAGFDDHLGKPPSIERLETLLSVLPAGPHPARPES